VDRWVSLSHQAKPAVPAALGRGMDDVREGNAGKASMAKGQAARARLIRYTVPEFLTTA